MRHAILNRGTGVVDLPNDPLAREAALLGIRYLRCGRDDKILETLIGNASMPANRAVLDVLKSETLALGEDMPERLRAWEPTSTKKRWRREPTRNYRIGMVVEALVTGRRILIPYGKGEKLHVQLQRDLQAMYAVSGKPFEELSSEEVLVSLNRMWARRRKNRNEGKRLTERDLVELTKEPLPAQAGIHGIVPNTDVRESFPNLYPTRNDATKDKGRPYSICDAVANVLREARQKGSDYRTVLRVRPETLCRITEFSEHESNGRELDEGERVAVEVLPVLGQSAAAVEPGDGAFDHPTPGLDDEALHPIGSLDDLGLEMRASRRGPGTRPEPSARVNEQQDGCVADRRRRLRHSRSTPADRTGWSMGSHQTLEAQRRSPPRTGGGC